MSSISMSKNLLTAITILIAFTACQKPDKLNWNSHLKAPIAHAGLGVNDLILEDSSAVFNEDNSISLHLEQDVYELQPLDNLVGISIEPFIRKITIDELALDNVEIDQKYSSPTPPPSRTGMMRLFFLCVR